MTQEASAGRQNAAENVADKTSALKITAIRGFSVAGKIYIKVETNHKITGWGETYGLPADNAISLAESLLDLLEGKTPRASSTTGRGCTVRIVISAVAKKAAAVSSSRRPFPVVLSLQSRQPGFSACG